ncbi:uncharacterized protein LOC123532843 isoform X2 [Mercenaria mercenaria]|uniref:uncharacterized protein LOC123532843 isoform X2 n=1 Tax=Mercenaria mercenaria TaxID=6596 RepID=UPI00234F5CCC|nr:uncharacterized protein LOC123532843 isoform X2 [Mercenaria mercenaria]
MFIFCILFIFMEMHISTGIKLTYVDCGSISQVDDVINDNCKQEPCVMITGHNYTGTNHAAAYLHLVVILNGTPLPLVSNGDQCSNGLHCPLRAGEETVWSLSYNIPIGLHPARLAVKYELNDEAGKMILCLVVPVILTN